MCIVYTRFIEDFINMYRLKDVKESDIPIGMGFEELEDHSLLQNFKNFQDLIENLL
jgi:hypothetical protein